MLQKNSDICDSASQLDPFLVEVIRNGLVAATEEMKIVLTRTAYNMIIYEALDFTVGLFTPKGETVSIGLGLPMFIRGMSETVKAKLAHFGVDRLEPGDILLTNDAYTTGSHLNHLTFSMPIFDGGDLIGFSSCMAHWPDVGGSLQGITTDIYSEGLQIPFVKVYRAGEPNDDVIDFIRMNVRLPDRAMGDFRAQVAAVRAGEKCYLDLINKYGRETVKQAIDSIMDQSEAAARARLAAMPDGAFEAEAFMDDDGVHKGKKIPIRLKVEIKGDRMIVDLTDVADQVSGYFNSGETSGRACCQVAFKCLTSPNDLPINEGQFRPLEVVLPPGTVVSAVKPAAMRMWMTFPMTVVDTIFRALSPAIPNKVIAGHHADLIAAVLHGNKPSDGSFYIYLGGLIGGGWGAKHDSDGECATICINDGDTHNGPSEQVESKYPLLVEKYGLREDSGGPGRWRGGLGAEQVVTALAPLTFSTKIDRTKCRPWGLAKGEAGMANAVGYQKTGEHLKWFASGKTPDMVMKTGDSYVLRSGGGGGYGSPLERPEEQVLHDVVQGYVTRSQAEERYGVVVKEDNTLDNSATLARRAHLKENPPPDDHEQEADALSLMEPSEESTEIDPLNEEQVKMLVLSNRCSCC